MKMNSGTHTPLMIFYMKCVAVGYVSTENTSQLNQSHST